eukprot:SAG22_NODE_835_length_6917_cov_8.098709_5_plen_77_part_00
MPLLQNLGPDYKLKPADYHVHAFPHWNWAEGQTVSIWSFSNAAEVELVVNGVTVEGGKVPMPKYGHVEWSVPFAKG